MADSKKYMEDGEESKNIEVQLSADEIKLMKQLESGKEIEDKTAKEAIKINDPKYKWFLEHLYDIDPKLGLVWKDYDQMSKQRKVVFHLLKEMGSNLLKGKSIMSVSLPVTIHEPQTMLERLSNVYVYVPCYAERMFKEKDPVERLKHYVGFSIGCLYISLQQKKPFNPIWGETFQGYLGSPEFKVYCEQVSHHPPISNLMIDTPWVTYYASHYVEANTYPNSIKVRSLGNQTIVFKDEQRTTYKCVRNPEVHVGGLVMGKRTMSYEGIMEIHDVTNKIYAQARFNPEKQGFFEKIFSKTTSTRSDFFKGFITKNEAVLKDESRKAFYSKDMLSYFEGQWLEYVIIDGEHYWQLGREQPAQLINVENPLQSDTSFRQDVRLLKAGDIEGSQKAKVELEELQRRDRKLRSDAEKLRATAQKKK